MSAMEPSPVVVSSVAPAKSLRAQSASAQLAAKKEAIARAKERLVAKKAAEKAAKQASKAAATNSRPTSASDRRESTAADAEAQAAAAAAAHEAAEVESDRLAAEQEAADAAEYAAAVAAEEQRLADLRGKARAEAAQNDKQRAAAEEKERLRRQREQAEEEERRAQAEAAEAEAAAVAEAEAQAEAEAEAEAELQRVQAQQAAAEASKKASAALAAAAAQRKKEEAARLAASAAAAATKERKAKRQQALQLAAETEAARKDQEAAEAQAQEAAARAQRERSAAEARAKADKEREQKRAQAAKLAAELAAAKAAALEAEAAAAAAEDADRRRREAEDEEVAEAVRFEESQRAADEDAALEDELLAEKEYAEQVERTRIANEELARQKRRQLEVLRRRKEREEKEKREAEERAAARLKEEEEERIRVEAAEQRRQARQAELLAQAQAEAEEAADRLAQQQADELDEEAKEMPSTSVDGRDSLALAQKAARQASAPFNRTLKRPIGAIGIERPVTAPHRDLSFDSASPGAGARPTLFPVLSPPSESQLANELAKLQAIQEELSAQAQKIMMLQAKQSSENQAKHIQTRTKEIAAATAGVAHGQGRGDYFASERAGGGSSLAIRAGRTPESDEFAATLERDDNDDDDMAEPRVDVSMSGKPVRMMMQTGKLSSSGSGRHSALKSAPVDDQPEGGSPSSADAVDAPRLPLSARKHRVLRASAGEDEGDEEGDIEDHHPSQVQFSTSSILRKEKPKSAEKARLRQHPAAHAAVAVPPPAAREGSTEATPPLVAGRKRVSNPAPIPAQVAAPISNAPPTIAHRDAIPAKRVTSAFLPSPAGAFDPTATVPTQIPPRRPSLAGSSSSVAAAAAATSASAFSNGASHHAAASQPPSHSHSQVHQVAPPATGVVGIPSIPASVLAARQGGTPTLGPNSHRSLFSTAGPPRSHSPAESDTISMYEGRGYRAAPPPPAQQQQKPQQPFNSHLSSAAYPYQPSPGAASVASVHSPTPSTRSQASAWSAVLSPADLAGHGHSGNPASDPANAFLSAEELLDLERKYKKKLADLKVRDEKRKREKEDQMRGRHQEQTMNPFGAHGATVAAAAVVPTPAPKSNAAAAGRPVAATSTGGAGPSVKKAPTILRQPENYGQRFDMQQQAVAKPAPTTAGATRGVRSASAAATEGPSLEELDAELKALQAEEDSAHAPAAAGAVSSEKKRRAPSSRELLSKPSNRQLLLNALTHVCLAGATMAATRTQVLAEMKASPGEHFLILLKLERALTFRAVYLCNLDTQQALRLYGDGPDILDPTMIATYYKYDSASKTFKDIASESLTPTTAAVILTPTLQRRAGTKKKA